MSCVLYTKAAARLPLRYQGFFVVLCVDFLLIAHMNEGSFVNDSC